MAIYTLENGTKRVFAVTRVRREGRVAPKACTIWPRLWSHRLEFGNGAPLVLPVSPEPDEEPDNAQSGSAAHSSTGSQAGRRRLSPRAGSRPG